MEVWIMFEYANSRAARIIGPCREVLTRDSLPPPDTSRWVASRKAQVVAAVQGGLLSIDEVLRRYNLSLAEYYSWQHAMDRSGVAGLSQASLQHERTLRRQTPELQASAARQHRELNPA
jgi:hypothetical protein